MASQLHQRKAIHWLLILATMLTLSACGFHLRSAPDLAFKSIFLSMPKNTPLYINLSRQIRLSGVEITSKQAEAEVTLQLLSEKREKKIDALDTSGNVREYALYDRYRFQLVNKDGSVAILPFEIVMHDQITYNPNQDLAKQVEEESLYRAMQQDVVLRLLRRLAAFQPKTSNNDNSQ